MPLQIVRNDITKMHIDAIVNTASAQPAVGAGCDYAVYQAAGWEELLAYRKEQIGYAEEGSAFLTPGFGLPVRYIIHTVSPLYQGGREGEEEKLRSCYRESLALAAEQKLWSLAFPLIATGSFGYPKEEGLRIAVDEIQAFLQEHEMQIFLVVFDGQAAGLGRDLYPDLKSYIDARYVEIRQEEEYKGPMSGNLRTEGPNRERFRQEPSGVPMAAVAPPPPAAALPGTRGKGRKASIFRREKEEPAAGEIFIADEIEFLERRLAERMQHKTDTFSEYLLYLIRLKGMENAEVYKRAIVDKKVFSKIKNHPEYHPQKITALCLCVGARLSLDETRDLLARAGYALSPCDKTDIIFSYFIEHEIYDMIELDIQLEEYGLPCIIS